LCFWVVKTSPTNFIVHNNKEFILAKQNRCYEVKTQLSEREYLAVDHLIKTCGFTEQGGIRFILLEAVIQHEKKLSSLERIYDSHKTAIKQP
jgi:hypothetical protein